MRVAFRAELEASWKRDRLRDTPIRLSLENMILYTLYSTGTWSNIRINDRIG